MAVMKNPIASDSAAELHDLIGEDASAMFESDAKFIDSNPTGAASSEHVELRDTDDTEDSEEEEDEEDEDDDEEDDDEEDEDEEDDDDFDDDEEEDEDDADEVLRAAEPVDVHGPGKHSRADIEEELEEMEEERGEEGDESLKEDEEAKEEEGLQTDLAIDEALRMSAITIAAQGRSSERYGFEVA